MTDPNAAAPDAADPNTAAPNTVLRDGASDSSGAPRARVVPANPEATSTSLTDIADSSTPTSPMTEVPVVETSNLSVGYESGIVLHHINLKIGRGEVVALMGANGSGKSTLVKTILSINMPTSGEVRVFGVPTTDRRGLEWQRIGYVPQRLTATSGVPATAAETVSAGLLDRGRLRVRRKERKERTLEALRQVGLADRANDAVQHLSGGQQQRVLLARALVRRPDLLVLDEPLAGMDQPSQQRTLDLLRELTEQGMTVLVVLHEVEPLEPLITRAVVLRHGHIVHDGALPPAAPGHDHLDHDHEHHHGEYEPYQPDTGLRIEP